MNRKVVFYAALACLGPLVGYIADEIFVTPKDFHNDMLGPVVFIAWSGICVILAAGHEKSD